MKNPIFNPKQHTGMITSDLSNAQQKILSGFCKAEQEVFSQTTSTCREKHKTCKQMVKNGVTTPDKTQAGMIYD